ncbi:MAG: polyprenol phosphomannose-dependent alpha 1,6 mannosyltransferase MptB [Jatrophihabitantaceae bacterium]
MTGPVERERLVVVATLAAVAMAVSSWWIGAVSVTSRPHRFAPVRWLPWHGDPAHLTFYLGLTAFTLAWLRLGRRVLDAHVSATPALLRRFVLCSAVPFLFAAPLGRDLWAYAAQGHLTGTGLDPYSHGPIDAPGAFTDEVSARWLGSSAPYGPLWLRLSQLAAWAAHGHPEIAAMLLRLPEFAALLGCLWALRVLAERLNGRLGPALWLGVASPLTIVLGVGGGHNDLLMIAVALAGLGLATGPGLRALAIGAAVAGIAVMIKSPAVIVVAFTVPVWLHANAEPRSARRVLSACGAAIGGSAVAVGLITTVSGLGIGWTRQVNSDAQWVSWLSLPSAAAMIGKAVSGSGHVRELDDAMRASRTVGELLAIVLLVALWFLALRRAPLGSLASALGAAALLAPSVQPWYYAWSLAVIGLVSLGRRASIVLAAVTVMFPAMIAPSGLGAESDWRAPLIALGSLAVTAIALRRTGSTADDDGADHPGAEVRADHRAELGHV